MSVAPHKTFSVDARTILQLGRQSIKDNTTALIELVKNSYDADATLVEIEICQSGEDKYIRIADNGIGMTESTVDKNWLRIGFSEKRVEKISSRNRRKTGEKGVGRLSADRLGAILELRSKAKDKLTTGLRIDWSLFDVTGQDLSHIPVSILSNINLIIPTRSKIVARSISQDNHDLNSTLANTEVLTRTKVSDAVNNTFTGTELIIRNLREEWTYNEIEVLKEELMLLTPPFGDVTDFRVFLSADIASDLSGWVTSDFNQAAVLEMKASLIGNTLKYTVIDRTQGGKTSLTKKFTLPWNQVVERANIKNAEATMKTGPVEVTLLFYLREYTDLLSENGISLSDLRDFLEKNAGVKVYRDNIRVRPYGDPGVPEGDWLGLDVRKARNPAGVSRSDYKFTSNQVVGAVFLTGDNNPELIDSSNREGLIRNEAFIDLRNLTLACLRLLEIYRHDSYRAKPVSEIKQTPAAQIIMQFSQSLSGLTQELNTASESLRGSSAKDDVHVMRFLDRANDITSKAEQTENSINEVLSQLGVLRGLSTIGIAASVFGHETQSSLSQFISSTTLAKDLLTNEPIEIDDAVVELEKAIRAADSISAWGAFSLARVNRSKRRRHKVNINETISHLIDGIRSAFISANIHLEVEDLQLVSSRLFEMDIESATLNLLTNAYAACLRVNHKRVVRLSLNKRQRDQVDGFEIVVADSGPGVADHLKDVIWQPLITFKQDEQRRDTGTGLGLTIVESIINEYAGEKSISRDPQLGGARFTLWIPIN